MVLLDYNGVIGTCLLFQKKAKARKCFLKFVTEANWQIIWLCGSDQSSGRTNSPECSYTRAFIPSLYSEVRHHSQMCHADIYMRPRSLMVYNYRAWITLCERSPTSMKNLSPLPHAGSSTRHRDSLATESALSLCFIHILLWPNFLWFRQHKKMRHKGNFSQGLKPFSYETNCANGKGSQNCCNVITSAMWIKPGCITQSCRSWLW